MLLLFRSFNWIRTFTFFSSLLTASTDPLHEVRNIAFPLERPWPRMLLNEFNQMSSALPHCPNTCEALFGKLEDGSSDGGKIQEVEVQIRGEPKSGTGMTQEWAWGALAQTCVYLQELYGEKSCQMILEPKEIPDMPGRPHSMIFEPRLAQGDVAPPCTCHTVERVKFVFSAVAKHRLPVDDQCGWAHPRGITDPSPADVCRSPDALTIENRKDLRECVEDNGCPITDTRLQVAVIRDPRAVTVSAYFQYVRLQIARGEPVRESVDTFFRVFLEPVCMWTSIRYHLFVNLLPGQSIVLFYEDAIADPVEWHKQYLHFIGLNLPLYVIHMSAHVASGGGNILGFRSKGFDKHPGARSHGMARSFREELSNSSLVLMDDVLRKWLPDVLLERYGVTF